MSGWLIDVITHFRQVPTMVGDHGSGGAPKPPFRRHSIDDIRDPRQWKYARAVFFTSMGPPKAEDTTLIRLQEMG